MGPEERTQLTLTLNNVLAELANQAGIIFMTPQPHRRHCACGPV